jgi:hypothetical protein
LEGLCIKSTGPLTGNPDLFRFITITLALTLAFPPALNLMHHAGWIAQTPSFLYETTWFVAFTTTVLFIYLYRSAKPSLFVQLYLLSMAVKLVACFAFNLLMILDDKAGAVRNVLYFLVVYVLFTALEIVFLYRRISDRTGS